jgi:poly(A) polymerase
MAFLELNRPIFQLVGAEADALGLECFVIGGFVRDLLLGRPCKDIDFMCVGNGLELAEKVALKLGRSEHLTVFKNFGTAHFVWEDLDIEFVGARKESYRRDSRNPDVSLGSFQDDLNRRDFTINTLAICLNKSRFGALVDTFDGVSDLNSGIIRTPVDADKTFDDDPLRMLRAIRFAMQLNFDIHPDLWNSMPGLAKRMDIVAKERIADEINKMMACHEPGRLFLMLDKGGLLEVIFPEFCLLKGVEKVNGLGHKDNFYHTLEVLNNLAKLSNNLWLRWAAVMHDIAKPQTKRFEPGHGWTFHGHEDLGARMVPKLFKKLGLPGNEKMKFVEKMVKLHLRPIVLAKHEITDSALRRLLMDAGEDLEDLLLLCQADITSKNPSRVSRYLRNYEVVKQKLQEVEEKDHIRNFQPPVSGEEIIRHFGIGPGPVVGQIKSGIKESILEGRIPNERSAAWALMIELGADLGLVSPRV